MPYWTRENRLKRKGTLLLFGRRGGGGDDGGGIQVMVWWVPILAVDD